MGRGDQRDPGGYRDRIYPDLQRGALLLQPVLSYLGEEERAWLDLLYGKEAWVQSGLQAIADLNTPEQKASALPNFRQLLQDNMERKILNLIDSIQGLDPEKISFLKKYWQYPAIKTNLVAICLWRAHGNEQQATEYATRLLDELPALQKQAERVFKKAQKEIVARDINPLFYDLVLETARILSTRHYETAFLSAKDNLARIRELLSIIDKKQAIQIFIAIKNEREYHDINLGIRRLGSFLKFR